MEKFYQACFSRLGGNDIAAGWQTLNVSPGIPLQLKELFERTERANQPMDRDTPKDDNGNALCMLELLCDGNNVGISRVQYGLADSFGRENMFCHGYMFLNAYELLKDPNNILRISDSNFHFTPEQTSTIPEKLALDEPISDEEALRNCGMDQAGYVRYISCIYYALATNAKTTIYVKTDGSNRMARALLYLAYSAVPYSLRTKISAATYANPHAQNVMLVLCPEIPGSCMYIDPASGDNNILTSSLQNRWKRYPFVTFYAQHYKVLAARKEQFYGEIEKWLTRMGDPFLKNMDAIRLAFSMMQKDENPDVAGLLYDWLTLPVPNNETLEQSVAELLKQAINQNIDLGRDKEQLLFQRLETAASKELIKLGNQYQAGQLMKMGQDEAVNFLNSLTPESPAFNTMRENLSVNQSGLSILREFYLRKAKEVTDKADIQYEDLEDLTHAYSDLPSMEAIWNLVVERAVEIAKNQIHNGSSFDSAATQLGQFLREVYPSADWDNCLYNLAVAYDLQFRRNFDPKKISEYEKFYQERYCGGAEQFACSYELLRQYQAIQRRGYRLVGEYIASGCAFMGQRTEPERERQRFTESLLSYALYCGAAESCLEITFWDQVAEALHEDLVKILIQKKVRLFCDPYSLSQSIAEDSYWTDKKLERAYSQYRSYVESYSDNTYKKSADVFAREIKRRADEAKKAQKEQKKLERQDKESAFSKRWPSSRNSDPSWNDTLSNHYEYEDCPPASRKESASARNLGRTKSPLVYGDDDREITSEISSWYEQIRSSTAVDSQPAWENTSINSGRVKKPFDYEDSEKGDKSLYEQNWLNRTSNQYSEPQQTRQFDRQSARESQKDVKSSDQGNKNDEQEGLFSSLSGFSKLFGGKGGRGKK